MPSVYFTNALLVQWGSDHIFTDRSLQEHFTPLKIRSHYLAANTIWLFYLHILTFLAVRSSFRLYSLHLVLPPPLPIFTQFIASSMQCYKITYSRCSWICNSGFVLLIWLFPYSLEWRSGYLLFWRTFLYIAILKFSFLTCFLRSYMAACHFSDLMSEGVLFIVIWMFSGCSLFRNAICVQSSCCLPVFQSYLHCYLVVSIKIYIISPNLTACVLHKSLYFAFCLFFVLTWTILKKHVCKPLFGCIVLLFCTSMSERFLTSHTHVQVLVLHIPSHHMTYVVVRSSLIHSSSAYEFYKIAPLVQGMVTFAYFYTGMLT